MAVRRRVKQALVLAGRCARLEADKAGLQRALDQSEDRARSLGVELAVLKQKLGLVPQPQSALLAAVEEAEQRARAQERRGDDLLALLQRAEEESKLLKQDLALVLRERAGLDTIRRTIHTLAVDQSAPSPSGTPGATGRTAANRGPGPKAQRSSSGQPMAPKAVAGTQVAPIRIGGEGRPR